MGCWGFGIMQSDDSLDAEADILDVVGVDWNEKDKKKIQQSFSENFDNVANLCNHYRIVDNYSCAVYWQVFAYHIMKNGIPINAEQQEEIIDGITFCQEYKTGKAHSDLVKLKEAIVKDYIEKGGEESLESHIKVWGEESMVDRVVQRTQSIDQLLNDLERFTLNNFHSFERKNVELMQSMPLKTKSKNKM